MSTFLNIVERAYQGTLEEQDDQALWLIGALKKAGLQQAILLRGPAVAYAVKEQSVGELHIGGVKHGHPPHIDRDLERLAGEGIPLYLVTEDAEERGIRPQDTVPGVQWVAQAEVPKLFVDAQKVLAW